MKRQLIPAIHEFVIDNHYYVQHMFCGRRGDFVRRSEQGCRPPMYVCICNALKDKQLSAAASGASAVSQVFTRCGKRPQCGKCLPDIAQIIEDVRADESSEPRAAAE